MDFPGFNGPNFVPNMSNNTHRMPHMSNMLYPYHMAMMNAMNPMGMYAPFRQGFHLGRPSSQEPSGPSAALGRPPMSSAGSDVADEDAFDGSVFHGPNRTANASLGRSPSPPAVGLGFVRPSAHEMSDVEEGDESEELPQEGTAAPVGEFLITHSYDNRSLYDFPVSKTVSLISENPFSESSVTEQNSAGTEDLLASLRAELEEPEGDGLRDDVAVVINQLWKKDRSVSEAKAIFDKYPRPSNLNTHKVFMNPRLHVRLPKYAQSRDLKLRSAQGAVAAAAVPIATLINSLQNGDDIDPKVFCPKLTDTIGMLGMASKHVNRIRRELVKPNVNAKFRSLCDKSYDDSNLLLGDSLQDEVKEAGVEDQLFRNLTTVHKQSAKQPFNAKGARAHPYKGRSNANQGEKLSKNLHDFPVSVSKTRFLSPRNLLFSESLVTDPLPSTSRQSADRQRGPQPQGPRSSDQVQDRDQVLLDQQLTPDSVIPAEVSVPSVIDLNKWGTEFEAGRISLCVEEWAKITSDPVILSHVRGLKLEFDGDPSIQAYPMPEIRFSEQELNFVRQEIATLLNKKVIVKAIHCEGEYISNIFLVEKKEPGKYRMILNLKHLNKFTKKLHFKMETLLTTLALITPGAYLMSFDFQDAYYSCSIFEPHRKYLRFMVDGQLYEFCALPNGLSSGPRIFTKLVKVALTHLRLEHDVTISAYLDDSLLVEYLSLAIAMIKGSKSAELLQKLGFTINIPKSVAYPVTAAEHLGFWIDSVQMLVSLTPKKVDKIIKFIDRCLNAERLTIRDLASVKGKIEATRPANLYALLMCKNLEIAKIAALKASNFNYDRKMALSAECRKDLLWAKEALPSTSAPIRPPPPDYTISTDSSKRGWGINDYQTMQRGGGRWSFEEALHHINELELKAAYFGLRGFCADMHGIHLRIMVDNTSALAAINKQGSTRSLGLNVLARELWDYARERRIWVSAAHIPGRLNVEADTASREFDENTEWSLRADIFGSICDKFGKPTIDLFASRLNCKVLRYCAWQPDPSAVFINALMMSSWEGEFFYAFPPFSIIHSVIQKCIQDRAKGILVVPDWPSQPWYTVLNSISLGDRFRFTVIDDELFLPFSSDSLCHPLAPLRMMATKVNGALISST